MLRRSAPPEAVGQRFVAGATPGSSDVLRSRRCEMGRRLLALLGGVAAIAVASLVSVEGQAPTTKAQTGPAIKTSWGEPDLQGLWTDEYTTPLQRPAKFAGREFLTDAEIAELD